MEENKPIVTLEGYGNVIGLARNMGVGDFYFKIIVDEHHLATDMHKTTPLMLLKMIAKYYRNDFIAEYLENEGYDVTKKRLY